VEKGLFVEISVHRQACILSRATTCWKAILEGSTTSFAIKDSWQYDGKDDEGELLMDVSEAGVRNVHHTTTAHRFALVAGIMTPAAA
jgi:hypothetical protein